MVMFLYCDITQGTIPFNISYKVGSILQCHICILDTFVFKWVHHILNKPKKNIKYKNKIKILEKN